MMTARPLAHEELEEIAEVLELPVETIQSWNLEACTVV